MNQAKLKAWKTQEELIELAEIEGSPPSPPPEGIPKQRVPGWIRWPIRVFFLPFLLLDLFMQKVVRFFFKTPYKMEGTCNQRGNCCYFILIHAGTNWYTKLYYFWNTEINGFYPRQQEPLKIGTEEMMVMGCRYLKSNGQCGHHRLRPTICREWPQIEYFGPPKILKGCGFKAVPRNADFDPYPQENKSAKDKLNILK